MPVDLTIVESTTELGQTVVEVVLESSSAPGPAGPGVPIGGTNNQVLTKQSATDFDTAWEDAQGAGGGAPADADYLVGTAHVDLSAEIVVGTAPGGELGGTWAAPTVDATHSGSSHAATQAAAEATAAAALSSHEGDTTSVHGIADTSVLATDSEVATAVSDHSADTTAVHGIADTSAVALTANHPSNATFNDHSARHEDGGPDEITLTGLAGIPTELQTHLDDATAAHAGSAISVDSTTLSGVGTTVQASLEELDNLLDDHSARHENGGPDEISIAGLDGTPTELTNHLNDAGDAHDASAISVADAGGYLAATEAEAALQEIAAQLTTGWIDDSAATWTRTANQTFTVSGDRTAVFTKGTRLRWTQTTVKYGTVVLSSHAAGTTTVTIALTSDYVLTAAAITVNSYSYAANPQGYPTLFNFVPVITGFASDPGVTHYKFSIVGNVCWINFLTTPATSNATTFGVTIPIASVLAQSIPCRCQDNGANQTAPGKWNFNAGTTASTANKDMNNAAWTASGNKFLQVQGFYEF